VPESSDVQPIDVARDVLPLFAAEASGAAPSAFLGTGFLVTSELLLTCWHCVSDALNQGYEVHIATRSHPTGQYTLLPVSDLEQDANGADLASGKVGLLATLGLTLAEESVPSGTDVWTYGYPLTTPPTERRPQWLLEGRFLQGYVTRQFYYGDGRVPSYEIDMRAPAGLSGAPLVQIPSRSVVGVVYGVNEVGMIEHLGRVDPTTGERQPEIQRVESFALGHRVETLRSLIGRATEGRTLAEHLHATSAQIDSQLAGLYPHGSEAGADTDDGQAQLERRGGEPNAMVVPQPGPLLSLGAPHSQG
jgi:hypothetical protein